MATLMSYIVAQSNLPVGNTINDHLKNPKPTGGGDGAGIIKLNAGKWMNIAIPVTGVKIKEYLMDWLADIDIDGGGKRPAEDWCELAKAFPSTNTQSGAYLTFVPAVTNPSSSSNFDLVVSDTPEEEITGFLLKMKDYTSFHAATVEFPWNMDQSHTII